jgi:hypothetical protein
VQAAQIMRDQLAGLNIPPSTYVDSGGNQLQSVPDGRSLSR